MDKQQQDSAMPLPRRIKEKMTALGYIASSVTNRAGGLAMTAEFNRLRDAFRRAGTLTNAYELVGHPDRRVLELLTFPDGAMNQALVFQNRSEDGWETAGILSADEFLGSDAGSRLRGALDPALIRLAAFLGGSRFPDYTVEARPQESSAAGGQLFSCLSHRGRYMLETRRLRLSTTKDNGDYTIAVEDQSNGAWRQTGCLRVNDLLKSAPARTMAEPSRLNGP